VQGLGVALVPRLLITQELACGDLVVACERPLSSARAYYLVRPERDTASPAMPIFQAWLIDSVASAQSFPLANGPKN
jgi:DNA-binding transcriptional LysR family regulator